MTAAQKVIVIGALVAIVAAVRVGLQLSGPALATPPATTAPGAHMDYQPRHGGLVLMNGDTHFEVLVDANGTCRVYFSDAERRPLPAASASDVRIGLDGPSGRQEVALTIDTAQESWTGHVDLGGDSSIVRVTYTATGARPYWIDVPLTAWPAATRDRGRAAAPDSSAPSRRPAPG